MDGYPRYIPLRAFLADRLRDIRKAKGMSQDAVAQKARRAGLDWTRDTVHSIEHRYRELGVGEFLLLPLILGEELTAFFDGVQFVELMPMKRSDTGAESLEPRTHTDPELGTTATTERIRNILEGKILEQPRHGITTPADRVAREKNRLLQTLGKRSGHQARLWPKATPAQLLAAESAMSGVAEQKAAAKLRLHALDVSMLSFRLWGCSLTDERDRRVAEALTERSEDNVDPRRLQALRGHVTRSMLTELDQLATEVRAARRSP